MKIKNIKKQVKTFSDKELLKTYEGFSNLSSEELLKKLKSNINGLTEEEAVNRLKRYGHNVIKTEKVKKWYHFLLESCKDPFIYILTVLEIIDLCLGDPLGAFIILALAVISITIRLVQDRSAYQFDQKLKGKIYTSANVLRNKETKEIKTDWLINKSLASNSNKSAGIILPAFNSTISPTTTFFVFISFVSLFLKTLALV